MPPKLVASVDIYTSKDGFRGWLTFGETAINVVAPTLPGVLAKLAEDFTAHAVKQLEQPLHASSG